jgi:hypothetical protein
MVQDAEWTQVKVDLTEWAAGEPTVYIRWSMGPTDEIITYYGWNIDDVEIRGVPTGPAPLPGDLNCDGQITFADINPFVLRLTNPGGYTALYPDCPDENGDLNGNGSVGFEDINPFVDLITTLMG